MSMRKLIVVNTGSQVLGKAVATATLFALNIFVAASYGAVSYGEFTKILTFVAPFYLFSDFGMNAVYLQKKYSWETLFSVRLVWSAVLCLFALGILALLPKGTQSGYTEFVRSGILLFVWAIIFQGIITSANAFFQKVLRYDRATVALVLGSAALLLFSYPVFIQRRDMFSIQTVLGAILVGNAVTAAASLFFVHKLSHRLSFAVKFSHMKDIFVSSIPFALILIFNLIYFRVDNFILILTRSTAEVGIYGLAYKIFETVLVVPTFFMNAVYPLLVAVQQSSSKPEAGYRRMVITSLAALFIISANAFLIVWFASPLLSLVRPEFAHSVAALRVLSLGFPFFFLTSGIMWSLIAKKRQGALVWIYAISMMCNILANLVFIPRYGYMAAAWITVLSEGIVLLVSVFVLFPLLRQLDNV